MNRRLRWRQHLAVRSVDFARGDYSGIWKFSEFFFCYLKHTTRREWLGGKTRQSMKIEYLLTTYDDCSNAPPQFKMLDNLLNSSTCGRKWNAHQESSKLG